MKVKVLEVIVLIGAAVNRIVFSWTSTSHRGSVSSQICHETKSDCLL